MGSRALGVCPVGRAKAVTGREHILPFMCLCSGHLRRQKEGKGAILGRLEREAGAGLAGSLLGKKMCEVSRPAHKSPTIS